jgi:hypothetical protein
MSPPTQPATWTLQQLREAIGLEVRYEYLIHDRDSIFAKHLDESIGRLGVKALKSPPRSPLANAICQRVIGTISRVPGLADSPIGSSVANNPSLLGPALQSRTAPHEVGSGDSGSPDHPDCQTDLAPSPRRTLRPARRSDPRRTPSRVHIGDRVTLCSGSDSNFCGSHPLGTSVRPNEFVALDQLAQYQVFMKRIVQTGFAT